MRRTWKWVLAMVGIVAACLGLLALDVYQRALRAIEAEEARLRSDIAALVSRTRASGLFEGRDVSKISDLPCPDIPLTVQAGRHIGLDTGHIGQLMLAIQFQKGPSFPTAFPVDVMAPDRLLTALAVTEYCTIEGGYEASRIRRSYNVEALALLRGAMAREDVLASDLQKVSAALGQFLQSRPSMADVIEGEHLLDRAELLQILRSRGDGHLILVDGPGWKELFSWRILIVKALRQLEERKRELMSLKSDSLGNWEYAAQEFGLRIRHEPAYTRSRLCSDAANHLQAERQSLLNWQFTQLATRIALFIAENGRRPKDLEELGGEVPVSPYNGKPFEYRDGVLRTPRGAVGPRIVWVSPRR